MPETEFTHPPAPVLGRSKSPGTQEFQLLLNALPGSALIVDRSRETVFLVNTALLRLTFYTQTDLVGARAADLLEGLTFEDLEHGDDLLLSLKRRKRDPLVVSVSVYYLDPAGQWLLLGITTPDQSKEALLERRGMVLTRLKDIARLADAPDLNAALSRAVTLAVDLFGTNLIAIYQADSDFPRLVKVASQEGENKVFPDSMPSTDLIRLSNTTIWIPGKRVQTEIHRYSRIANLVYTGTTPLGQDKAMFGLLAIGDVHKEPFEIFPAAMEIVASNISAAIQHFVLQENLVREILRHEKLITTHNAVFENSQEGILVLSSELSIREVNAAAEVMLGYANWEAQGQPVENILIGPERMMPSLEAACQGVPTHDIGSVHLHRRNGQSFPARLEIIPVMNGSEPQAVIVFLSDISADEQTKLRTQQLEHRAILGDVTAVFAHEVRNPINNISTGAQLMASRMSPEDPNLEILNRIEADCARLNHLMESVLAFSRPTEYKFEAVDLGQLIQRLLDRWRPRLARVNVEPYFIPLEGIPKVSGDVRALEQVFTNLISNAVEAMSRTGGMLAVKLSPVGSGALPPSVEVTVSDNGPGIPDDLKERIFEPFVTQKTGGTGLGLAITKRIITAHHGAITVDSFPGGTVFHVCLPQYQGE